MRLPSLPSLVLSLSFSALVTVVGCGGTSDASDALETQSSSALEAAARSKVSFDWPIPEGWRPETFTFPLPFAPDLSYRGVEELRFAPHPFDPTADTYFSYSYVWLLEDAPAFTADQLATDLAVYYTGLAKTFDAKRFDPSAHHATMTRTKGGTFVGVVDTVDPFNASRPLHLEVEGEGVACGAHRGFIVSVSPHPTGDALWSTLTTHRHTFTCAK